MDVDVSFPPSVIVIPVIIGNIILLVIGFFCWRWCRLRAAERRCEALTSRHVPQSVTVNYGTASAFPSTSNSNMYQSEGSFPSNVYTTPYPPYNERETQEYLVNPPHPTYPSSTSNLYQPGENFPSVVCGTPPPPYSEREMQKSLSYCGLKSLHNR